MGLFMIKFQIIEHQGRNLYKKLIADMKSGKLKTFSISKRGRKVAHTNLNYPGWINWTCNEGVITAEVLSPQKPGHEWQIFSALIGRLSDKYAEEIHSIGIQFPIENSKKGSKTKK